MLRSPLLVFEDYAKLSVGMTISSVNLHTIIDTIDESTCKTSTPAHGFVPDVRNQPREVISKLRKEF